MSGGERRRADSALLAALAAGATTEQASRMAGVSEATARRRLQEPDFERRLAEIQRDAVDGAAAALGAIALRAVTALSELLGGGTPPAVRLGAARAILEIGGRLREERDLDARLRQVEEMLGRPKDER
ncbi:MAG: hypothetical protein ACLQBX_17055 [Candidatus Limnocylindrales bacterium]